MQQPGVGKVAHTKKKNSKLIEQFKGIFFCLSGSAESRCPAMSCGHSPVGVKKDMTEHLAELNE